MGGRVAREAALPTSVIVSHVRFLDQARVWVRERYGEGEISSARF